MNDLKPEKDHRMIAVLLYFHSMVTLQYSYDNQRGMAAEQSYQINTLLVFSYTSPLSSLLQHVIAFFVWLLAQPNPTGKDVSMSATLQQTWSPGTF